MEVVFCIVLGLIFMTGSAKYNWMNTQLSVRMAGFLCWFASTTVKSKFSYDDSLDVVGVHGVGGLIGTLMVAFFANESLGGKLGNDYIMSEQFLIQVKASMITIVYTLVITVLLLLFVKTVCGGSLRVSDSDEEEGLDVSVHGEQAYNN